MACLKHTKRKRKDCPDCIAEKQELNNVSECKQVIPPAKERLSKKVKPVKSTIQETIKLEIPEPQSDILSLNKSLKDEIVDYIKKEVRKAASQHLSDILTEGAIAQARETADVAFQTALVNFNEKVKPLTLIRYEHLTIPASLFNVDLLMKLQREGWGYRDLLRGEVAKQSGFKTDSVIMVRVKNDKWPDVPKF